MDARARYLLDRRSEGTLTALEAGELERSARQARSVREELASWARFESALKGALDDAPELSEAKIARTLLTTRRRPRPPVAVLAAAAAIAIVYSVHEPQRPALPVIDAPPVAVSFDGSASEGAELVRIQL